MQNGPSHDGWEGPWWQIIFFFAACIIVFCKFNSVMIGQWGGLRTVFLVNRVLGACNICSSSSSSLYLLYLMKIQK